MSFPCCLFETGFLNVTQNLSNKGIIANLVSFFVKLVYLCYRDAVVCILKFEQVRDIREKYNVRNFLYLDKKRNTAAIAMFRLTISVIKLL